MNVKKVNIQMNDMTPSGKCERGVRYGYCIGAVVFSALSMLAFFPAILPLIILVVLGVARLLVVRKFNFYDNIGFYACWLTLDISLFAWPFFAWSSAGFISVFDYTHYVSFSITASGLFVFLATYWALSGASRRVVGHRRPLVYKDLGVIVVIIAIVWVSAAAILSIVAYKLGLDRMGTESSALPFQLNGVIIYGKRVGVVLLAILLLDYFYGKKLIGVVLAIVAVFLIWNGLEAYLRLSKGQILTFGIIPLSFWLLSRRLLSWKLVIVGFVLMMMIGMSLRQLNLYRRSVTTAVTEEQDVSSIMLIGADDTMYDKGLGLCERVFREVPWMANIVAYDGGLHIYSPRFEEVRQVGSPTNYMTYIILGANAGKRSFAAGMSLFTEAYFMSGAVLVWITAVVFASLARLSDSGRGLKLFQFPAGRALFCYIIYIYMFGGIWTWIYKGVPGLVYPAAILALEYIARYRCQAVRR